MHHSNQGRFRQQVGFLRRQFVQDGDLPFSNVLSEEVVSRALTAIDAFWMDRIYPPLVTLWVFLGQVLSADHSCRAAVARLIAHRISRGQSPCSAETGAYCQARKRLPEKFFSDVARQTGRALEGNVDPHWLWKRRSPERSERRFFVTQDPIFVISDVACSLVDRGGGAALPSLYKWCALRSTTKPRPRPELNYY